MRLAREEALLDDVPGVVCSVRIVVSRAIQALVANSVSCSARVGG